jgi:hypothetical protein
LESTMLKNTSAFLTLTLSLTLTQPNYSYGKANPKS